MTNPVTVQFVPGFRLIDGSDLNALVSQVNSALTGGGSETFGNITVNGTSVLTGNTTAGNVAATGLLAVTGNATVSVNETVTGNATAGNYSTAGSVTGVTITGNSTINAGLAASAGTINIFPATTASGHVAITASNAAGNTTTTINVASQAGNRTYTWPDAIGNGTVAMTRGSDLLIQDTFRSSGNA